MREVVQTADRPSAGRGGKQLDLAAGKARADQVAMEALEPGLAKQPGWPRRRQLVWCKVFSRSSSASASSALSAERKRHGADRLVQAVGARELVARVAAECVPRESAPSARSATRSKSALRLACCTTTCRPCARAASRQRSTAGRAQPRKQHLIPSAAPGEQAEDRHPHGGRVRAIGQQPVMLDEQGVEAGSPLS